MLDIKNTGRQVAAPELLCPVGSPDVLEAAVGAGADAVYLGASAFNARINAKNFDSAALANAVTFAHQNGVRVYLTLNTAVFDRELALVLKTATDAAEAGVDAFIIADLGAAAEIHRALPNMPLHASTQMSGHGADIGKILKGKGFTRFVIAREATLADLRSASQNSGLEVEAFVHGALCVSHSGQCLFSSIVGGRSGNRGECAQPCRLPYGTCKGCNPYPLSLKDLSLAAHVPELIESGVSSLKIEGRMKSADYVRTVTSIWRTLLDGRRAATPDEMRELSDAFSRGGFTDGYFTGKITHSMMGIRSDEDKARSASLASKPIPKQGFLPLDMTVDIHADAPVTLTVTSPVFRESGEYISVSAECEPPEAAQNRPTGEDDVLKNLSKTGGTAYTPKNIQVNLDGGLMLPLSRINSLRRDALSLLDRSRADYMAREAELRAQHVESQNTLAPIKIRSVKRTARFLYPERITNKAWDYFDLIYIPLTAYRQASIARREKTGVILPPVIFDRERSEVKDMLVAALADGVEHIILGNIGHIELISEATSEAGVKMPHLCGDYRLNVTNSSTSRVLEDLGIDEFILSPELTLPKMRDIKGDAACVVYGRITLMTLEKCAIRELYGKNACDICGTGNATMRDRRGICFPILREWKHRNVILNSLPLSMTDKEEELSRANITSRHFIFTTEDESAVNGVIKAAENKMHIGGEVRRISK